jgi:hypothetical protein
MQIHQNKIRFLLPILLPPLLLALVFSLSACGKRVTRGETPFVRITALMLSEQWLDIELSVRNRNDVPLQIDLVRFQLNISEKTHASYDGPHDANVVANGSERLSFRIELPPDKARARLEALEAGDIVSLPYHLEGEVHQLEAGTLRFENDGHVYPVPGRPGHFR